MKTADIKVSVLDLDVVQEMLEFCWHHRECAAIDADGEWHIGNKDCDCGYDEVIARFEAHEKP